MVIRLNVVGSDDTGPKIQGLLLDCKQKFVVLKWASVLQYLHFI